MAINIFKKKPTKSPSAGIQASPPQSGKAGLGREKKAGSAWQVLKTPHVTEKATDLAEKNQYIFNIYQNANKSQVKKAVEDTYGVDVLSVRIINVPRKKRRLGKNQGWKEGYKKAITKIKEGQKIEVMPR